MRASYALGLIGSVVTLVAIFEMLRRRRLREKYAVLWVVVALLTLLVALFPPILYGISEAVGVQVPANLLFFVASMLLLLVSIQHSYELGRLEERTRTLAEEVALLRLDLSTVYADPGAATEPASYVAPDESLRPPDDESARPTG